MNEYSLQHGLKIHCKTCNKGIDEQGHLLLIDGECEECNDAYLDSLDTDSIGLGDDAVS